MDVREIGFDLLISIYKNKNFSNIELNNALNNNNLSSLDKSFLTNLI